MFSRVTSLHRAATRWRCTRAVCGHKHAPCGDHLVRVANHLQGTEPQPQESIPDDIEEEEAAAAADAGNEPAEAEAELEDAAAVVENKLVVTTKKNNDEESLIAAPASPAATTTPEKSNEAIVRQKFMMRQIFLLMCSRVCWLDSCFRARSLFLTTF